jgi:hypothetical protein
MSFFDLVTGLKDLDARKDLAKDATIASNLAQQNPLGGLIAAEGDIEEAAKAGSLGLLPYYVAAKTKKERRNPTGLTPEQVRDIMRRQFGEGTYQTRAQDALPGILQAIQDQRTAQIPGVPSIQNLLGFNVQPTTGTTTPGLLNTLSTSGMNQIQSGQFMNPTIFRAKG